MRTPALLLALLLPVHAVRWAHEGNLHPFDSRTLRAREAAWEGNDTTIPPPLHLQDLLVVLITTTSRLSLVLASRRWRQGLFTVIVSDRLVNETEYAGAFAVRRATVFRCTRASVGMSHYVPQGPDAGNEVWCTYPDTPHPWQKRGDLRAAMAPFLANVTVQFATGTRFKWMLFGDDDTVLHRLKFPLCNTSATIDFSCRVSLHDEGIICGQCMLLVRLTCLYTYSNNMVKHWSNSSSQVFHVPNTLRLLQRIHPDVPHMLSDALWFHGGQEFHHNRLAPRCLPCHYDDVLLDEEDTCPHLGFQAPRVCKDTSSVSQHACTN